MNLTQRRLSDLPIGRTGMVLELQVEGINKRRLLDLGMIPGTRVTAVRRSPAGDPVAYRIRGAVIALRKEEAKLILIQSNEETDVS